MKSANIYGTIPDRPLHLSVSPTAVNGQYLDGRCILKEFDMEVEFDKEICSIPFKLLLPKVNIPCPVLIELCDGEATCDVEEWLGKGYGIILLSCGNISDNNADFKSKLCKYITPSRRKKSSAGKICVWAWALIRALECAEVLEDIDKSKIGVGGKGIFGLAALLARGNSDGFAFTDARDIPKIDRNFILSNPHLFSPECVKMANFDNFN